MKKINVVAEGHDVETTFFWWPPKFGEVVIKLRRSTLGTAVSPFFGQHDL